MVKFKNFNTFTKKGFSIITPTLLFLVLAFILSFVWFNERGQNKQTLHELTEIMSEQVKVRVKNWIELRFTIARYLALKWKRQYEEKPALFSADVQNLLKIYPGIQAINWIDSTWTIRIVNPYKGNEAALNKDLHQHPSPQVQEAIGRAALRQEMSITSLVPLLQGGNGFATYYPVIKNNQLIGFINIVFRVDTLISRCLDDAYLNEHFDYLISDDRNTPIYSNFPGKNKPIFNYTYIVRKSFPIGNKLWHLAISPSQHLLKSHFSLTRNKFFIFNLVLSLAIAYLIWILLLRHARIKQSEAHFRSLFEAANTWIHLCDLNGKILKANPAFFEQTELKETKVLNRNLEEFLSAKSKRIFSAWLQDLENNHQFRSELEFLIGHRRKRVIDCFGSVIFEEDQPIFLILHSIDITDKKQFEYALNESEEKYRAIVEQSHDGIFIYRNERLLFVNHSVSNITEYSIDELYQISFWDLIHPADRLRLRKSFKSRRDGQFTPTEFEVQIVTRNGNVRFCKLNINTVKYQARVAILGTLRDITQERQARKALEQSEERYRKLFENVPVGIYRSTESGELLAANPAMVKILGYDSFEELSAINVRTLYVNENERTLWINLLKFTGLKQSFETTLRRKDGKIIWVRDTAAIQYDASEDLYYFEGVLEDISEQKRVQFELQESERRFKEMANLLPQGIFECDAEGRITYINNHALRQTGYTQTEILHGMRVWELFAEIERPKVRQHFQNILQSKPTRDDEFWAQKKDGTRFPALLFTAPIRQNNRIVGLRGILIDISQRKAMELALRESEDRYRSLVEQNPDAIIVHDQGKIIYANQAALNLYEVESIARFKEVPALQLIHPDFREIVLERMKRVQATEEIAPLLHEKHITLKGKEIDVEVLGTAIRFQGKTVNLAIIRDISEKLRTKRALQESEERFKSILTSMIDMVFLFDPRGKLLFFNAPELPSSDLNLADFKGKPIFKLLPKSLRLQLKSAIRRLNRGETVKLEFDINIKKGNKRWFSANVSPMIIEDQIYGYVAVTRDITERKQAELRLAQTLHEKEILLQEVHHRVKNNLQSLFYLIQTNKNLIEDKASLQVFTNLQNQLRAMSLVYEQLYHSSNLAAVDMKSYLINLVNNIRQTFAQANSISINLNIKAVDLPVDKALPCGMIVNELISNVFKYAFPDGFKGDKQLKIDLLKRNGQIALEVFDTGVGFTLPEDLNTLSSMGLKLVYLWATHQLGGTIKFDTKKGTKIRVSFPI